MIQAGYMAKRVSTRPGWDNALGVVDIYSVSNCISEDFCDYIPFWKHNGYWLFDSPETISNIATANGIDLVETTLFYYEMYEWQFDNQKNGWLPVLPESSLPTNVIPPREKFLQGYDIVTVSAGTAPECSPLSCNAVAEEIETNRHCLLDSFEKAKALLEEGRFKNTEPGPFRIVAVYTLSQHSAEVI